MCSRSLPAPELLCPHLLQSFISLHFHITVHHEGSQSRNSNEAAAWRQELVHRPWKDAAYWLAPHGLLSLLSYRTQEHQPRGDGTTKDGLGLHQSPIKEIPYRLVYSPISQRYLLN